MTAPKLTPLSFEQSMLVETYREGYKASIASANGSCEKITTGAFALATAYGALIALVVPEDAVPGWMVAAPIVGFVVAAVLALTGHVVGQDGAPTADYADMQNDVKSTLQRKRKLAWAAIAVLAGGICFGGIVTYVQYGSPAEEPAQTSQVELTSDGVDLVSSLCGNVTTTTLHAEQVTVAPESVTLGKVRECSGADLTLPSGAVAGSRSG
jgi:hypothetical protein